MLIIFDLDGTLINTIDDLGQACNHALSACGFPTHKIEDYPRLVGNGINKLIERALPEEHRNEEMVLRLRGYFVPFYDEHNCDLTRPYDGIPELLKALKQKGDEAMRRKGERLFLAVASNKYQVATEKIVAHYFPNTFDVVLGERDGVPRKPDPQIVYDILGSGITSPESGEETKILYIGDSLVDVETAKAANVRFVACAWGFCTEEQLRSADVQHLIHYPAEILSFVN